MISMKYINIKLIGFCFVNFIHFSLTLAEKSIMIKPPGFGTKSKASREELKVGGYTYKDGTKYVGEWNSKGQKHGFGHLQLPNSIRYVGNFKNGLCSGLGVMMFPDGARYEGEFMEGWFHGRGVFLRADGMKYEGEFRGGRLWGWGLVTFRDSTHGFPRNEGFFQDCRLIRNKKCTEVVELARKVATIAKLEAEEC